LELSTVKADDDIQELFEVIKKTRFGFAWVEGKFETGGFASLRDLLGLYENGVISTDMTLGEVASSIVSLDKDASLKTALGEMFSHRFRRIFVGDRVISDRRIIGYIFSPSRLNQVMNKPETLLDSKLGELEGLRPINVGQKSGIISASKTMRGEVEECLICEKGVVTPWDMLMKPWIAGKLKIAR
jgi:CBS domain-containing protein